MITHNLYYYKVILTIEVLINLINLIDLMSNQPIRLRSGLILSILEVSNLKHQHPSDEKALFYKPVDIYPLGIGI